MTPIATGGTGAMLCAHCGKPMQQSVWIGGFAYHFECTQSPHAPSPPTPVFWPVPPAEPSVPVLFGITERRLREIVREELARREAP